MAITESLRPVGVMLKTPSLLLKDASTITQLQELLKMNNHCLKLLFSTSFSEKNSLKKIFFFLHRNELIKFFNNQEELVFSKSSFNSVCKFV